MDYASTAPLSSLFFSRTTRGATTNIRPARWLPYLGDIARATDFLLIIACGYGSYMAHDGAESVGEIPRLLHV